MAIQSSLKNMVLVLTGTCLVCSALLGVAYVVTKDPIAKAEKDKTVRALAEVLPAFETVSDQPEIINVDGKEFSYYVARTDTTVVGYAIESKTGGFGGELTVMVGIDAKTGFICNTAPLKHSETPGLGAECEKADKPFRQQWVGLNPAEHKFEVKKDIDAISASTITSKAYTECVKQALAAYKAIVSHE